MRGSEKNSEEDFGKETKDLLEIVNELVGT